MIVEVKQERLAHLECVPEQTEQVFIWVITLVMMSLLYCSQRYIRLATQYNNRDIQCFYSLVPPSKVVDAVCPLLTFVQILAPTLYNSVVFLGVDLRDHTPEQNHICLEHLTLLTFVRREELILVVEEVFRLKTIIDPLALAVTVALVEMRFLLG